MSQRTADAALCIELSFQIVYRSPIKLPANQFQTKLGTRILVNGNPKRHFCCAKKI